MNTEDLVTPAQHLLLRVKRSQCSGPSPLQPDMWPQVVSGVERGKLGVEVEAATLHSANSQNRGQSHWRKH